IMKIYQDYHPTVNEVYKELYGIDFPHNPNYSPGFRDVDLKLPESVLLAREAFNYASTKNGSLKARVPSNRPIKFNDATAELNQYIMRMEDFKAWEPVMKDMRRVFGDENVKAGIRQNFGRDILKHINKDLQQFARGGYERAEIVKGVDFLRRNFTKAILGFKPAIGIKQIPSVFAYSAEMPYRDFVEGVADFWKHPIKNYRFLKENSPQMRRRFKEGHERDVRDAMKRGWATKLASKRNVTEHFMILTRLGDKNAVVQGSWAKYKSALKEGKSQEEAIKAAERTTGRTQPTADLTTLASGQRYGSWWKILMMFQNQPNKYFRMVGDNLRNFEYGRGDRTKAFSNLMLVWVVLPSVWQLVTDAFQWKWTHQARAAILGPINFPLALGGAIRSFTGWVTGERFPYRGSPILASFEDLMKATFKARKIYKNGKDPMKNIDMEDVIKMTEWLAEVAGQVAGIPTPYGVQVEKAIRKGEPKELIFSEYALDKEEKKKPAIRYKPSKFKKRYKKEPAKKPYKK
ncbi:MAG: hypothetical protein KAS32_07250, partial [Candidatus Peribacteraceae bacterium]|nr:hypothetical protein [Candidatus Peribacteraceae bacterium]